MTTWKPKESGPYVARSASDRDGACPIWYVAGADGRTNILSGPGGAVLTDKPTAIGLAAGWNGERGASS